MADEEKTNRTDAPAVAFSEDTDAPRPTRRRGSCRRSLARLSILEKKDHLHSEISHEQIREIISFLQSCGHGFRGFGRPDIAALAEALSVMNFDEGQKVVEKGEMGTWFGVLLSGTLKVLLPNSTTVTMHPGAVIGEMAVWKEDSVRNASMEGGERGLIATMLQAGRIRKGQAACLY